MGGHVYGALRALVGLRGHRLGAGAGVGSAGGRGSSPGELGAQHSLPIGTGKRGKEKACLGTDREQEENLTCEL